MKFKNRENELITKDNIGDREIFHPRSVAIVATIIIKTDENLYVLMNQRGTGTPDFQGLWNMPCGYLDWDESATEAVYREVYEETGVNLPELLENNKVLKTDLEQPWYTNHLPDSNRQNITLRFGAIVETDKLPHLTNEYSEPDEVSDLRWIKLDNVENYECAFNHPKILEDYVKTWR